MPNAAASSSSRRILEYEAEMPHVRAASAANRSASESTFAWGRAICGSSRALRPFTTLSTHALTRRSSVVSISALPIIALTKYSSELYTGSPRRA